MQDQYTPKKEDLFTFGLWTVGNRGRDPFGDAVRPPITPLHIVKRLSELGAYGVNLHDNDLVPFDASVAERDKIVKEFKTALSDNGMKVPMATVSLFYHPIFRDGAFTSNNAKVRAFAVQKTMRAMDLGVELGAKIFVLWGGREGVETDASKSALDALKWYREAINFLCEYAIDQKYDLKFALEAKPNEPRGDIYLATTGHMLAFIETLDHPNIVGVNPEVAHEHMSGLNFYHGIAQSIDAGKLFHIDLNDQKPGRYDQDLRFGSESIKPMFYLVKLLEESGYKGPRHFDAHAYRSEDEKGVWDFALGCMRTYNILRDKARQYASDPEIQELLRDIRAAGGTDDYGVSKYSKDKANKLKTATFDVQALSSKGSSYERLDQMVTELILGVRGDSRTRALETKAKAAARA
ncbi:MAG: xylose isomerase [Candidatus Melainabacteria bacterium]|nr:MAG: xylose isomerase [Candidatus Melainabacteria bacterium]